MNLKINLWLQEEIEKHAKDMAVKVAAKKTGRKKNTLYATEPDRCFGTLVEQPEYGFFTFLVKEYRECDITSIWEGIEVELKIQDVIRDYLGLEIQNKEG